MGRIACAKRVRCAHGSHIVSVGLGGDDGRPAGRLTVAEVYAGMGRGEVFHTHNGWHAAAAVAKDRCGCGAETLRSAPGAVKENNLDRLSPCRGDGDWEGAFSESRTWVPWGE
jgi:hypothetical protein